jgi:hypothetical protein
VQCAECCAATLWLNLGDSYANDGKWGGASSGKHSAALHGNTGIGRGRKHTGAKPKDLLGMPWRVAAYEMIFLLTKAQNYYYDADAIAEPTVCDRIRGPALHPDVLSTNGNGGLARRPIAATRNCRNVWTINTKPCKEAHFAVMAPEVARRCVLAGCPAGGAIIDPFGGAGTTGLVAAELGRGATLIELNPDYVDITCQRLGHLINRRF